MGRKATPGLQFYRVDCGHIQERKQRLLFAEFDSDGYYIWSALTDYAHATWGYYFDYSNTAELEWFASDVCRKKINLIKEVIQACVRRELFDKDVFAACQILTCEDMQDTYLKGTADRRSKGTIITMHEDHLCIPPHSNDRDWRNINIVQGKTEIIQLNNKIVPPNNSQREKIDIDKKERGATGVPPDQRNSTSPPVLKTEGSEGQNAGARKTRTTFVAPSLDQVKAYFLEKIGDTKDPRSWPHDKCVTEASKFFNHYTANGWVQGKGKKLVDWNAAVRNWITNEMEGAFSNSNNSAPAAKQENKPAHVPTPALDKTQQEINYLYESFLEGNEGTKFIYTQQYDYLVNRGLMNLTDQDKIDIRARSLKSLQQRGLPTDKDAMATLMKKEAVVEFFRQQKILNRNIVFEL